MRRINKLWAGLAGLGVLFALSGCSEHLDNRDSLTRGVGDAVARNRVTHTINPWPPVASNKRVHTDGERGVLANDRYRRNESIEPKNGEVTGGASQGASSN